MASCGHSRVEAGTLLVSATQGRGTTSPSVEIRARWYSSVRILLRSLQWLTQTLKLSVSSWGCVRIAILTTQTKGILMTLLRRRTVSEASLVESTLQRSERGHTGQTFSLMSRLATTLRCRTMEVTNDSFWDCRQKVRRHRPALVG